MAKCGKVTNRACTGKVAWPNKRKCAVEARRRGTGLVAYLCAMCGWWHLGHRPRSGEPTWPDGWRPHQLTQRGGADCWCGAHHDTYGDVAHLNFATFNLNRLETEMSKARQDYDAGRFDGRWENKPTGKTAEYGIGYEEGAAERAAASQDDEDRP